MFLLALFACTDDPTDKPLPTDTGATYDHPLVPEQYRGSWDEDSVSCDDAIYYWAFSGTIDADGAMVGTEGWYWFFSDEGAATDCVDVFEVTATEERTPVADDPCISCDRDFTATYTLTETGCNWAGYEQMFDNDDVDRIDEEVYSVALMLDALDNDLAPMDQMNVWSFAQDDRSATSWLDRSISTGTYVPDGSDTEGAAAVDWTIKSGVCVTIED